MARANVQRARKAMQDWTKSVSGTEPAIVAKLPAGYARALAMSTVATAAEQQAPGRYLASSTAPTGYQFCNAASTRSARFAASTFGKMQTSYPSAGYTDKRRSYSATASANPWRRSGSSL